MASAGRPRGCSSDPPTGSDRAWGSLHRHGILSFLDAFTGYHQIPMPLLDAEKTTFITRHRVYCYNVMSLCLKNAGATYQRMVTRIFQPLKGKSMEDYIDDMLVKSKERPDHTRNLQKTFELLRRHNMKLNPLKCAFGVNSGKFLSFMVTQRGIKANPIQLKAIMDSQTPHFYKRGTTIDWSAGGPRAVHILLHRSFEAVLCHPKGSPTGRLESRIRLGFFNNQTISHRTTSSC